jgi:hypothetical protein
MAEINVIFNDFVGQENYNKLYSLLNDQLGNDILAGFSKDNTPLEAYEDLIHNKLLQNKERASFELPNSGVVIQHASGGYQELPYVILCEDAFITAGENQIFIKTADLPKWQELAPFVEFGPFE